MPKSRKRISITKNRKKQHQRRMVSRARRVVGNSHSDKVALELFKIIKDKTPADTNIDKMEQYFKEYYQSISFVVEINNDAPLLSVITEHESELAERIQSLARFITEGKVTFDSTIKTLREVVAQTMEEFAGHPDANDIVYERGAGHVTILENVMSELLYRSDDINLTFRDVLTFERKLQTLTNPQESEQNDDTRPNTEETTRGESEKASDSAECGDA